MYQFNNLTSNVPNVQTFNATNSNTSQFTIGQSAFGGVVAYILQPTDPEYDPSFQKGIIAATADQGSPVQWYNGSSTTTGATATAIGTGGANTTTIIRSQGAGTYAASVARNYANEGLTDWYLPSKDELNKLYLNKTAIGGFALNIYWSSSESTSTVVWAQNFTSGVQTSLANKSSLYYVRPIRSFSVPNWQTWTRPNDALLIHILCIGGGGGGGSGRKDTTAGTLRIGGAGGGSAAVTSMYVPAFLIPDTLYVQVGLGGAGGAAQTVNATDGNAGVAGGTSYVALYPKYTGTEYGNLLLSANGGGGGPGGTTTITGTVGAGGTATAVGSTSPFYLGLGQFTSTAGQSGTFASAPPPPVEVLITGITGGGAAGGSISTANTALAGGDIISPSALIPYLTSLAGGAVGNVGNNGYAVKKPLMYIGGTGGGGATTAVVPSGGNGAIGCGGGGGGASSSTSSGAGGKGGDGIVIITSYSI
jgi:hypothetical protein